MRKVVLVALALASASPAHSQTVAALKAKATAHISELREEFDNRLLDYTTARFKGVRAGYTEIGAAPYFCGQVNSKNNSGAYVGWRYFAWQSWSTEGLVMEGADGEDIGKVAHFCTDNPDGRDPTDYSAALTYHAPQ